MENLTINKNNRNTNLYMKNKMYISNDKSLQLFLLSQHHNLPTQSHPGFKTMVQKLQKNGTSLAWQVTTSSMQLIVLHIDVQKSITCRSKTF